jgi:hypothetical protein
VDDAEGLLPDGGVAKVGTFIQMSGGTGPDGLAFDEAGNSAQTTHRLSIDTTDPEISSEVSGEAGNAGWYTSQVTVTFTCTDPAPNGVASGIPSDTCPEPQSFGGDGQGLSTSPVTVLDRAGNESAPYVRDGISIDQTPPVTVSHGVPSGWTNQPVSVTLSATDAGSGVEQTMRRVSVLLAMGSLLAIGAAALLFRRAAGVAARPLDHVVVAAGRTAAGHPGVPRAWHYEQTPGMELMAIERMRGVPLYGVAQALDRLFGIREATIVGHSLGGAVAVALAEQSPKLVGAVVVMDTVPDGSYGSLGLLASAAMTGGCSYWPFLASSRLSLTWPLAGRRRISTIAHVSSYQLHWPSFTRTTT